MRLLLFIVVIIQILVIHFLTAGTGGSFNQYRRDVRTCLAIQTEEYDHLCGYNLQGNDQQYTGVQCAVRSIGSCLDLVDHNF